MSDSTDRTAAVRDLYTRLIEAWNARDATRYAGLFTEDGTVIGFDGSQSTGAQIAEHLQPIFDDHPTAAYVAKVRQLRELAPDVVLLRAIAGMIPPDGDDLNPRVHTLHTVVAERHGADWRIVLFQNTPAQYHGRPELTEQHTAELRPLVVDGTTVR